MRVEAVDCPTDVKAGRSHTSRAPKSKEEAAKQGQEHLMTRQDIVLWWEAERGSSTALVGLGRGREALAEAKQAMELADQVRERARVWCAPILTNFRVHVPMPIFYFRKPTIAIIASYLGRHHTFSPCPFSISILSDKPLSACEALSEPSFWFGENQVYYQVYTLKQLKAFD